MLPVHLAGTIIMSSKDTHHLKIQCNFNVVLPLCSYYRASDVSLVTEVVEDERQNIQNDVTGVVGELDQAESNEALNNVVTRGDASVVVVSKTLQEIPCTSRNTNR